MSRLHHRRNSHDRRRLKTALFRERAAAPCCFCGTMLPFARAQLEHVRPVSRGGTWLLSNLRLSCPTCNNVRKTRGFRAFKAEIRARLFVEPL